MLEIILPPLSSLVRKDAAGAYVAHHEVGVVEVAFLDAAGGGGVDEAESAFFFINFRNHTHVADVADAAAFAKENKVSFLQIGV